MQLSNHLCCSIMLQKTYWWKTWAKEDKHDKMPGCWVDLDNNWGQEHWHTTPTTSSTSTTGTQRQQLGHFNANNEWHLSGIWIDWQDRTVSECWVKCNTTRDSIGAQLGKPKPQTDEALQSVFLGRNPKRDDPPAPSFN